jgi:dipeptidyl aminopeptidase/acylaminoacyl peptidase
MDRLALIEVSSGGVRQLTGSLDRAVLSPVFSADGQAIEFAVEDDGYQYPAQIALAGGALERLAGPIVVEELAAAAGHTAVLSSSDHAPVEVYALEEGRLRALSAHNQALFAELTLGTVEDITFKSRDGTPIHGQQIVPPDFVRGRRYPTIVWIHGGPNGQDDHSLELAGYGPPLERQLFATHGYVVLAINYRGGTGRGAQFARSILGDWGHKEVEDLLAGVDYAIAAGVADPTRLGVGGWSYGGLLTDYTIASDPRFKAAIAGAGSGNQLSTFGSDEYVLQYNAELGPPWRTTALWLKVSYPFFHADRIRTPTLFLGGDRDFNVPIGGGEQMYQALRTLGVPAQLIVYPGEYHVLTRPSFLVDRSRRYLEWMDKYLRSAAAAAPASTPER